MFKNKFFAFLSLTVFAVLFLVSCEEDVVGPDPGDKPKPSPASNLQATSLNATTILLTYEISPSETNTLFKDYLLTWKEANGPTAGEEKVILKGTNPFEVTNLTEGKVYEFTLVARFTNDQVSSAISVKWSPATRFVETVNSSPIRAYETASDLGSGIQMFYANEEGPRVRKVANGKDWDFGIRTSDNKIEIGSATKLAYNYPAGQKPEATFFFKDYFLAESLDKVFDSKAMNDNLSRPDSTYKEITFDLTKETDPKNVVFYVRKYQPGQTRYNYAKIMMKRPAGGGSFLQGTSPNRYIEFEISYQKTVDVPYAKVSNNNSSN